MRDWANLALDTAQARGATYADVRVVDVRGRDLTTKNGSVGTMHTSESLGLGIRVVADGAWGFAATDRLNRESIEATAATAVAIARASATLKKSDLVLAPVEKVEAEWHSPCQKDPFAVSIDAQLQLLLQADAEMRRVPGVTLSETLLSLRRMDQLFASTIGSQIRQVKIATGVGIVANSFDAHELQRRSYPNSLGGAWALGGYEVVEQANLLAHAQRVGEEAVALHKAIPCPEGRRDLILDSSQLALQIHESIGHPIELDRVLGMEANFAGTSFLTLDQLNQLQYGSPIVNVVADARLEHGPGLGTFAYDDEGVPAQRTDIIKNGRFVGYITSRETAPALGQDSSNGTMRAENWNRIPLIRMTNISLLPGKGRLEDLIADTSDGIYMETNRSWSIDDRRYHFQFGTEIGWEIKNGRRGRMIKNPSYSGITTEFWNACDAICGPEEWVLWSTPNCGKGQPMQTIGTGHGAAPARFRSVQVGIANVK
jgi:TldD protein